MGRHSKPSKTKTILTRTSATAALAGATIGGLSFAGVGTANAFPGQAGLVKCESGGNPAAVNNTRAGQQAGRPAGLFQIVTGTWRANGGGEFAATADKAAPWQQQIVADRIYARQGSAPWECKTGSSGSALFANFAQSGGTAPASAIAATPASLQTSRAAAPRRSNSNPGGDYTVVAGDTLSGIAQKFHVAGGWAQLQKQNNIANADLILTGQEIDV